MSKKLNPKQERFCEEYIKDLNATQAAIRAGYSERTANEQGARLLANVSVRQLVDELKAQRSKRTQIDADWLLKRLAEEAVADIADLYTETGALKPVHEWPLIWRQGLVSGMDVQQEYAYDGGEKIPDGIVIKPRFADRGKRLEMIGRHVAVKAFGDDGGQNNQPPLNLTFNVSGASTETLKELKKLQQQAREPTDANRG